MTKAWTRILVAGWMGAVGPTCAAGPEAKEVRKAIREAVGTMREHFGRDGGYVWVYSPDGTLRMGEGLAGERGAWVQPPGTPSVGATFLQAWQVTGDQACLDAALETTKALVRGQLASGGWHYRIEFDPEKREEWNYAVEGKAPPDRSEPAGWDTWRKRRNPGNRSMLDDNTTQAALRFLIEMPEQELPDQEAGGIAKAVDLGLTALLRTQYPVGAWSHNFDSLPEKNPPASLYPVKEARFPDDWPREWPNAWEGCYHLNDQITLDCLEVLLVAGQRGRQDCLDAAKQAGEFLLRAQMPEPQPAWCQQYDRAMHPVWERKFEPPAITGSESQAVIATLLRLHAVTGEARFLEPIPRALAYLRKSLLDDGSLARFYELRTNRPLFFDRQYRLTRSRRDLPDHYSFTVRSKLDELEAAWRRSKAGHPPFPDPDPPSDETIRQILQSANEDGIWLEPGFVRNEEGRKVKPEKGILKSATWIENVDALCRWLEAQ